MDDSEPNGVAPLIEGLRGGSSFHDLFCLHMVGLTPDTGSALLLYRPSSSNSRTSASSRLTATMPLPQQLYQ